MTRSDTTGADPTGPDATGPDATGPDATGPDATGPDATGEAGRRQPAGRGPLDPEKAAERVRRGIAAMGGAARTAFTAGVAQRLAGAHLALPPAEHDQELLAWRPTLDAIWRGLAGDHTGADEVLRALARFYVRQQVHGQDAFEGEIGATHPLGAGAAVTATYYAAQCYLHGCADFARWAARTAIQLVWSLADEDDAWWGCRPASVSPGDWHAAHPAIQSECARQLRDLQLLAHSGNLLGDRDRGRLADRLRLLEALYCTDIGPAQQAHLFDGLPYFWLAGQLPDVQTGTRRTTHSRQAMTPQAMTLTAAGRPPGAPWPRPAARDSPPPGPRPT